MRENTPTAPIVFWVDDAETPATDLKVTGHSDNVGLVAQENIVFGGSGTNRAAVITPNTNQWGRVVITIAVIDTDGLAASESFTLTVVTTNQPPTNAPPTVRIAVSEARGKVALVFSGSDAESDPLQDALYELGVKSSVFRRLVTRRGVTEARWRPAEDSEILRSLASSGVLRKAGCRRSASANFFRGEFSRRKS